MSKNLRNSALIAAVWALAVAQPANAQSPVGARASGMAGAFVAVADDATAVYWNPAGVATGSIVSVVLDAGRFQSGPSEPQLTGRHEDTGAVVAVSATAIGAGYFRVGTCGSEPAVTSSDDRQEVGRCVTTTTVGVSLVQSAQRTLGRRRYSQIDASGWTYRRRCRCRA